MMENQHAGFSKVLNLLMIDIKFRDKVKLKKSGWGGSFPEKGESKLMCSIQYTAA
jgi:hypothetical protein